LILEKLNQFKNEWKNQTPVIETINSNDSNSTSEKKDSTKFKYWKKIDESLDRAINKRVAINECDFGFFKDNNNKVNFSDAQQPLKIAINKISKDEYVNVKSKLGNVLNLTLIQIADSINKINNLSSNSLPSGPKVEKPKTEKQNKTITTNSKTVEEVQNSNLSNLESEIIRYLKGGELKIVKLNEFKSKVVSNKLKKSIDFALEFWALNGSTTNQKNTYYSFKVKVQNDPNFKGSELLLFLEEVNPNTKYPTKVSGAGKTKTLNTFIKEATK
jgi:hypothetical protein